MSKPVLEIDGRKITSVEEFHSEIASLLKFPESYGKNLDALWDFLTGHADTDIRLIWKNHVISKERLGPDFVRIHAVFIELMESDPKFEFVLQ